ncbi:MAG: flagellar motor protein MotB [Pseudomonadota bacterium]
MARKQEEQRPDWETSNIGLMMFTSLMILLLAFFIMLSSIAVIDEKRQIQAFGSLIGAFDILPGGLSPFSTQGSSVAPPTSPMGPIDSDLNIIREVLNKTILMDKIHILRGRTRRIISLEAALLFPRDGVEITPQLKQTLGEIGRVIKDGDYPVVIEGHTDDQPPRTENLKDNWQVSGLRALAILNFFVREAKIDPTRLSAFGYGGAKPIRVNNSPENRARNNRVDIILDDSRRKNIQQVEEAKKKSESLNFKGFNFNIFGGQGKE